MGIIGNAAGGGLLPSGNLFFGGAGGTLVTGSNNIVIGDGAGVDITDGTSNVLFGFAVAPSLTTANGCILIGAESGTLITSGSNNIGVGVESLVALTTGSNNTTIGFQAGQNYTGTESSNVLIQNGGTVGESNQIRIGTQGSGAGQQNACNIAGIYGNTPGAGGTQMAVIDSAGNLGSQTLPSGSGGWVNNWVVVNSLPITAVVNTGYVSTTTLGNFNVPTTSSVGDVLIATTTQNPGSVGFAFSGGVTIHGNVGGVGKVGTFVQAGDAGALTIVCTIANSSWSLLAYVGNLTIT